MPSTVARETREIENSVVYYHDMPVPANKVNQLETKVDSLDKTLREVQNILSEIKGRLPDKIAERLGALEQHRDHKPHPFVVPMTITVLTLIGGGYFTWMTKQVMKIDTIASDLQRLQASIDPLLAAQKISALAQDQPTDLAKELQGVRDALKGAEQHRVRVHGEDLSELKSSLSFVPSTSPYYWPTVLDLVSYSSSRGAASEPIGTYQSMPAIYSNGEINGGKVLLAGIFQNEVVRNAWVKFAPTVRLFNVKFENCVFIFDGVDQPSEKLKKVGRDLLIASDIKDVTLSVS